MRYKKRSKLSGLWGRRRRARSGRGVDASLIGGPLRGWPRHGFREAGMVTSEYAVGVVAAVAFAAVLYKVVNSPQITRALQQIVEKALSGG